MSERSLAIGGAQAEVGAPAAEPAFRVTEGYRRYVIWLLFLIYVFN